MDFEKFYAELSDDRKIKIKSAIESRFGSGYLGLNAGITVDKQEGSDICIVTFCNFNSVSGWATIGALRYDEKKQKYIINFRGKGLGRTGKYR